MATVILAALKSIKPCVLTRCGPSI